MSQLLFLAPVRVHNVYVRQDGLKGRAASYSGSIESNFPDVWMFAGPRGESVLAVRWRRKQEKRR